MQLLVSVVLENFRLLRRAMDRGPALEGFQGSSRALPERFVARMGGRMLHIDWPERTVRGGLPLPTPSGFCWPDPAGPLWVASKWGDALLRVEPETGEHQALSHPAFNDPHGLEASASNRLLLACSGTDAVHELDHEARPVWSWWGNDNGFDESPAGARRADPNDDHRGRRYPTLRRAVHPTCAVPDGDGVLVTSFHGGWLARIDRASGEARLLREDLAQPHGLRRLPPGRIPGASWLLCDTGHRRVLALSEDFAVVRQWAGSVRWAQDVEVTPRGTLLVLDNLRLRGDMAADPGNHILELDPQGAVVRRMTLPTDWRLFSLRTLSPDRAARCEGWAGG